MMRQYEAISALAGSGKTYALTSRFIGLLAQGARPEEILAVTFTRKAAGEIFDRIVTRLAAAALHERARDELASALKAYGCEMKTGDPGRWLQQVLEAMPHLHIGTIDSLFVSIVQAFAMELGLPPRQEILDGLGRDLAREEALRDAMEAACRDRAARQSFMEAFRLLTFEKQKNVRDTILETADSAHRLFLYYPDPESWGRFDAMWPDKPWWMCAAGMTRAELLAEIDAFRNGRHIAGLGNQKAAGKWNEMLDLLGREDWLELSGHSLFKNLSVRLAGLLAGEAEYTNFRKYAISGSDARQVVRFLAWFMQRYVFDNLRKTEGIHRLMTAYEASYRQSVRARGRLSFEDIQVVLFEAERSGVKMEIDYRLDGRFRHWMLDEFQDTSARQWAVLGNLANEILQGGDDRSFFYVGDAKQAIYGWRGGDARLFDAVHGYYENLFGRKSILNRSWRSSPVVLKAVNQVFGDALSAPLHEHPEVLDRWRASWEEHQPAEKNLKLPGRVEFFQVDDENDALIGKTCAVVESLHRQKGMEIAVLVRKNSFGDRVASALRSRGVAVRREVNPKLCDNGVVSGLLALLDYADHPGDTFVLWHLEKCGLFDALQRQWGAEAGLPARLRDEAVRSGVAGLLLSVLDVCRDEDLLEEDFIEMRLRQLLAAARDFDSSGKGGPSDFAAHARSLEVKDPVVSGAVTVMTIHKAKGLEFDAVVLPDLHGELGKSEAGELEPFSTVTNEDHDPSGLASGRGWIFPLPRESIAQMDETFTALRQAVMNRTMYDELCLLYVAMTRAKQGLYMIAEKPPANPTVLRTDDVLRRTLADEHENPGSGGMLFEAGDTDWFRAKPAGPSAGEQKPESFRPDIKVALAAGRRLMVTAPSREEGRSGQKIKVLFERGGSEGALRGTALHELFQQVEWNEAGLGERILESWEPGAEALTEALRAEIRQEFLRALQSPEIITALSKPEGCAELWREQGFEMADEGRWITGRMDRVVILRDADGKAKGAIVTDFKSDRVSAGTELEERAEKYGPQIRWYIKAVSRLLQLPSDKIRAQLIFTCPGKVHDVHG